MTAVLSAPALTERRYNAMQCECPTRSLAGVPAYHWPRRLPGLGQDEPTQAQQDAAYAAFIAQAAYGPFHGNRSGGTSSALETAAAVDPEPFSKAILAITGFVASFFGSDPRKVPDTQVTEATQIALNNLWFQISGEQLPSNCVPGQCGAQHVAIFQNSAYPNVPYGPLGNPAADIDVAINTAEQIINGAMARLQRPQSRNNPEFTANDILALLEKVKAARQDAQTHAVSAPSAGGQSLAPAGAAVASGGIPGWLVILALGFAAYKIL